MPAVIQSIANNFSVCPPATKIRLTAEQISADGCVLLPQVQYNSLQPGPYHNAWWRHEDIAKPKEPIIIGHNDPAKLANSPWLYACGSFIVKPHNSDHLFLPEELSDFIPFAQQVLDYEFRCNAKSASERTAILLVESSEVSYGNVHRQIAKDMHAHPPSNNPRTATFNIRYYSTVSRDATGFHTGRLDLCDISEVGSTIRQSEKYPVNFRAQNGDIVGFTSVHAHQGGIETTPEDDPRVIAIMGWMDSYANVEPRNPNPMIERWNEESPSRRAFITEQWRARGLSHLIS